MTGTAPESSAASRLLPRIRQKIGQAQAEVPSCWSIASAIVSGWLLHLTLGNIYCWGSISPYVVSYMRLQGLQVSYEDMSWVISITSAIFPIAIIVSGVMVKWLGLRITAAVGCSFCTLGVFLSSIAVRHGVNLFLACYAGMFGFGAAIAYMSPILNLVRLLPSMKATATGIILVAYGFSALVFTLLQQHWVNPHGLSPTRSIGGDMYFDWERPDVVKSVLENVPAMFVREAIVFAVMQIFGVLLLFERPQVPTELPAESPERKEEDPEAEGAQEKVDESRDVTTMQMLRTWHFWCLFGSLFFLAQPILWLSISQKIMGTSLVAGTSDSQLTTITGISAVASAVGRVWWGMMGDYCGYSATMVALTGLWMVLLLAHARDSLDDAERLFAYSSRTYGCWFCVGGTFVLFPSAMSTYFGEKHMVSNYGVVSFATAAAQIMGSFLLKGILRNQSIPRMCYIMAAQVMVSGAIALVQEPPESVSALVQKMQGKGLNAKAKQKTYGAVKHT